MSSNVRGTKAQARLGLDLPLLKQGFASPQNVDLDKASAGQYPGALKADVARSKTPQVQR